MNKWKFLEAKFVGLYLLLGLFGALGVAGVVLNFTYSPPTKVDTTLVHTAQLKAAQGNTNLVYLCEASITNTIVSNGGKVKGYSHVVQKDTGPNKVKVTLTVGSDLYNGRLACTFEKSTWQLKGVAQA